MALDETDTHDAANPEELGIMLDRLAIELVHAQAKNPQAIPNLQRDALKLLSWIGGWFVPLIEPAQDATEEQRTTTPADSLALAQALRDLAEQLLLLAEIDPSYASEDD